MNNIPTTLSSVHAAQKPIFFDLRIVLLMLLVGAIDLFSGRKLFHRH